jgi:hypothetical protein
MAKPSCRAAAAAESMQVWQNPQVKETPRMARPLSRYVLAAALAVAPASARGQERPASAPPPPPVGTPGPAGDAPVTRSELEAVVNDAVRRAVAETRAVMQPPVPVGYTGPAASGQGYYGMPAPSAQGYVPTTAVVAAAPACAPPARVTVLVPPGPFRQALAACGRKLTALGEPRPRTLQLAPTATVVAAPAPAPVDSVRAVVPSGQY